MRQPGVVVMTEREALRALFRKAAGTSASALGFAASRSDLRILLGRGDVKAVLADHCGPGSMAAENLLWVQRHRPWIQLVLMTLDDPGEIPQQKAIQRIGRIVPVPASVAEAKELLRGLLERHPVKESPSYILERVDYSLDQADQEIIRSITQLIDQLPALPLVVQRILNLLHREETSPRQMAEVISLDPALAARVLRLVNSALFALAEPVTTVQHAVRLLGFGEIRNLTIGLKIMDTFSAQQGILDRPLFWEHSLACGVCARRIALYVREVDPDEAFLGGLLHDIGKLVLDGYFQEAWREALERSRTQRRSPMEMEAEVVGLPHTSIGRMLAGHWKIPDLHQMAIEYHHGTPPGASLGEPQRVFCATVQTADLLVRWLGLGSSGPTVLSPLPEELVDLLGLRGESFSLVLRETLQEVGKWKLSLGLRGNTSGLKAEHDYDVEEAPPVWVIAPPFARLPTLAALMEASGRRVETSYWGEPVLERAGKLNPQAVVMDFRWMQAKREKVFRFLRAMRSRIGTPILVVGSNALGEDKPPEGIHFLKGPPHLGVLERWLASEVQVP